MKRAALFVALLVLAWLVWDTGADPVRLARGVPWILDFFRRMMPPDASVLPSGLHARLRTDCVCPSSVRSMSPVRASHSRMLGS